MDVLIIGGGIAGVSLAARLAGRCRVMLLEREEFLAMHTTGRSAAMYIESYGNEGVRALTRASRAFFDAPPPGFTERPILTRRPRLTVAKPDDVGHIEELLRDNPGSVHSVTPDEAYARMPILRRDVFAAFAEEPDAMDIDVHALFDGFRRMAVQGGVEIAANQEVLGLSRGASGWTVRTREREFTAPIVVDAAGAWAGKIALMAGLNDRGLVPMRRTAVTIEPPRGVDVSDWMVVHDAAEAFYFKPDAGMILASPADETPVEPCDAQPEEEDVARIAWEMEQATTLSVTRIKRRWAGLRTFTPERVPIFEFDPAADGFFWLAGQGGYGIQTSPAISERAAELVLSRL